jgi:hypothetical protein
MRCAALCLALVGASLAATTTASFGRGSGVSCGGRLFDLKTISDTRRSLIYFRPQPTTIGKINARPMPRPTPTVRTRGFARHVWRVVAEITEYRLERDGEIHIILFDKGVYMIAAMPAAECLSANTLDRRAIVRTRQEFEARCGAATPQWRSLGAVVSIDGVGFWNLPRGQKGHARNYAELHPVTQMRYIAGCA